MTRDQFAISFLAMKGYVMTRDQFAM